jgi:hypothetical protein
MEYDYGCGWEFEIKLTKIYDTPENNSYPLVVSGK